MPFDFLKRKLKYPFNRRKYEEAKAVYAGPEEMGFSRPGDGEVLDVYAGPEPDADPVLPEDEEERTPREVRGGRIYAGPEFYGKRGARPSPKAGPALLVYAGPSPTPAPPPPPVPEDPPAPVYAGPEDFDFGEEK